MVGDLLQPTHLIFVLVIALLVLGPKRLPEVGRSLGRGMRDFKDAISGEDRHEPLQVPPLHPVEPEPVSSVAAGASAAQSTPPAEHSEQHPG